MGASNVDSALELHKQGFNVFPLRGINEAIPKWFLKKSKEKTTRKNRINWVKTPRFAYIKYRNNRASKEQIEKWWGQWPDSNIGIITKNLVIIDADSQKTDKWCLQNIYSPVRVKSYRGRHYYFRKNANLKIKTQNNGDKKIDIRGYDGIITSPGSTHGTGFKYQWDISSDINFVNFYNIPMMTSDVWSKVQRFLIG